MTWVLYGMAVCLSFSAILFEGNEYKRTHKYGNLLICRIGFCLLVFTLMFGAALIFVR